MSGRYCQEAQIGLPSPSPLSRSTLGGSTQALSGLIRALNIKTNETKDWQKYSQRTSVTMMFLLGPSGPAHGQMSGHACMSIP